MISSHPRIAFQPDADHSFMKGYALTPPAVVDLMVEKLFRSRAPSPGATVLDPGCGTGVFLDGVVRWCARAVMSRSPDVNAEYQRMLDQLCAGYTASWHI